MDTPAPVGEILASGLGHAPPVESQSFCVVAERRGTVIEALATHITEFSLAGLKRLAAEDNTARE